MRESNKGKNKHTKQILSVTKVFRPFIIISVIIIICFSVWLSYRLSSGRLTSLLIQHDQSPDAGIFALFQREEQERGGSGDSKEIRKKPFWRIKDTKILFLFLWDVNIHLILFSLKLIWSLTDFTVTRLSVS